MLPLVCPSPQPKRHLDSCSHFCTAHGRVSACMPGHVHSPCKLSVGIGRSGPHLIHGSLGPPESTRQTALRSVQPFLQGRRTWTVQSYLPGDANVHYQTKKLEASFTRYNLLSNRLSNWLSKPFDNRLYRVYRYSTGCQTRLTTGLITVCIVYTAGCQTGCQSGCTTLFDNWLNEQWLFVQRGCQTGLTPGCIV